MLLLFLFYLWYNIIISLHNISPMAPLCKRALRYLGIIKKYVLPRKSIAVFSCILITSLAVVGFVLFPGTSQASMVCSLKFGDGGCFLMKLSGVV